MLARLAAAADGELRAAGNALPGDRVPQRLGWVDAGAARADLSTTDLCGGIRTGRDAAQDVRVVEYALVSVQILARLALSVLVREHSSWTRNALSESPVRSLLPERCAFRTGGAPLVVVVPDTQELVTLFAESAACPVEQRRPRLLWALHNAIVRVWVPESPFAAVCVNAALALPRFLVEVRGIRLRARLAHPVAHDLRAGDAFR